MDADSVVITLRPPSIAPLMSRPSSRDLARLKAIGKRRLSSATTVTMGTPASQSPQPGAPPKAIWYDETASVPMTVASAPMANSFNGFIFRFLLSGR
jgi:hypothetical protein